MADGFGGWVHVQAILSEEVDFASHFGGFVDFGVPVVICVGWLVLLVRR